ncbi:hypothetical protein HZH68_014294 [Vespula germanica]|uniref:Uncharacterized protein n=1 Tax=Vespula germanica TaxID=30212 RepID=A0A834JB12_VESGE|nr:hypothetical protein HZH68_014294 [Vespula germanica]
MAPKAATAAATSSGAAFAVFHAHMQHGTRTPITWKIQAGRSSEPTGSVTRRMTLCATRIEERRIRVEGLSSIVVGDPEKMTSTMTRRKVMKGNIWHS